MNTLKTTVLLAALTGLLVGMGYLIGGVGGMIVFFILAGVMNFVSYWFSDKFALRMAGAREISESEDPKLYGMVAEVAQLAGMPMPKVYIIENESPNAFATGRNPEHAVVAVTTGIRRLLTERELRGVLGHEMGHVKNRDILTSSIVATIAGAIQMIAQMRLCSSLFGGRDNAEPDAHPRGDAHRTDRGDAHPARHQPDARVRGRQDRRRSHADPEALADALQKLQMGVQMRPMRRLPRRKPSPRCTS